MPTSGTHITIVQRLALDPRLRPLLGDPHADLLCENPSADARKMKFANLGAIGPDLFYMLADYYGALQDLENFLVKVGGTFECISEIVEEISQFVDGVLNDLTLGAWDTWQETSDLLSGVVKEFVLAIAVAPAGLGLGLNLWPFVEPARQKDRPREEWFWADYLHYIRTGRFTRTLLDEAAATNNPNLRAYALGYLTHYVVDTLGHPYVNQVVGAPWRMYWQRHHLVENFIDSYVWPRWHISNPSPPPPCVDEQPLDRVTATPNDIAEGAPFTFARLNDHINIGSPTLGDPVDEVVSRVCDTIKGGIADIKAWLGTAEDIDVPEPNDADFQEWTQLLERAIRQTYDLAERRPDNLRRGPLSRPDGYPTATDIGAAYGVLRLILKVTTEERIKEPKFPNITSDISQAWEKITTDIENNIGQLPPPPHPHGHHWSWDDLEHVWDSICRFAIWLADAFVQVVKAVFDFIRDLIAAGLTVVSDSVKAVLWLVNSYLYQLYSAFRLVLVLQAYAVPRTSELSLPIIPDILNTRDLWTSKGNAGEYPVEEVPIERDKAGSIYLPLLPPSVFRSLQMAFYEKPFAKYTAPYRPSDRGPATPDVFIDTPIPSTPDNKMFSAEGPVDVNSDARPDFGGAMDNCIEAILNWGSGLEIPDYNLDADRGYAWPCWDVEPSVVVGAPPKETDPGYDIAVPSPLKPDDHRNSGHDVQVKVVEVTG